jgi:hypothetical protein
MAALVPAIHVFLVFARLKTWMEGLVPGLVVRDAAQRRLLTMRVTLVPKFSNLIPRRREHPSRPSLSEAVANGARRQSAVSRDGH